MPLRPVSRVEGYTFPAQAWDVRGWTVRTEIGDEKVGKVEDMLLDGSGALRYLEVDLGFLKKHVLVPLERAHADLESETVHIEGFTKDQLEAVPEYALEPESLDEGYERRLAAVYGVRTEPTVSTRGLEPAPGDEDVLELRRMEVLEKEYRVAGEDPRGWGVVTADGQKIGEVAELLMEPGAMKARFLDVSVDEKKLDLERVDRHILLPAERVRLERSKKRVVVGGLLASDIARYPQYGGLPLRERSAWDLNAFFERAGTDAGVARPEATEEASRADYADASLRHFFRTSRRAPMSTSEERNNG